MRRKIDIKNVHYLKKLIIRKSRLSEKVDQSEKRLFYYFDNALFLINSVKIEKMKIQYLIFPISTTVTVNKINKF